MSKRPRRNHSAAFKAKVAIDALADGKTIAEVALKHDVHSNQVPEGVDHEYMAQPGAPSAAWQRP
ncbi:transposase [Variovorax humicola]|uniref:Transposase n=1 Tax=Variovorax humicola TaxID=1769758 RepID=A0ABU8VUV4_9BURK